MNTLDLPPRRPLPHETRERIRRSVDVGIAPRRSRAPAAAAAVVVLLAMGAIIGIRWLPDTDPVAGGPESLTQGDLDHCADAFAAGQGSHEFIPDPPWRPQYTVTTSDGTRVTAFLKSDGEPAFCEVTATKATVSDIRANSVPLAVASGTVPGDVSAVLLSPDRHILAGVAEGVDALEFSLVHDGEILPVPVPTFENGMFVVQLVGYRTGDIVFVVARNSQGQTMAEGYLSEMPTPGFSIPIG